jgi:hypothetical protein
MVVHPMSHIAARSNTKARHILSFTEECKEVLTFAWVKSKKQWP